MKTKIKNPIVLLLIAVVMLGFSSCNCKEELKKEKEIADSLQTALDNCKSSHPDCAKPATFNEITPAVAAGFMDSYKNAPIAPPPSEHIMKGAWLTADISCYISQHYNKDVFLAFGINTSNFPLTIYCVKNADGMFTYLAWDEDVSRTAPPADGHGSTCPLNCPPPHGGS